MLVDWVIYVFYVVEINCFKKEKNVVILVYNYMMFDIYYGVVDVVGDSL